MIRSNLHTHTTHCDGKNTAREMVEAALSLGFVSLGFSGHSALPFANDWAMRDEAAYRAEIHALAKEYQGQIEIACGIEWDLESQIDRSAYDYAIGSVHHVRTDCGLFSVDNTPDELSRCAEECFGGDYYALCRAYFSLVAESALREGVDIVGHFDVVTKFNAGNRYFSEEDARYRTAARDALSQICENRPDVLFEVNVGGMVRAGRTQPYPPLWILKELRKRGMGVVLSSDAHRVQYLATGFDTARELLCEAGYDRVKVLRNGVFTDESIVR